MRVVFRVDAARDLGIGHVRRCLSLAQALRTLGGQATFVARNLDGGIARDLVEACAFECRDLRAGPDTLGDARGTAAMLEAFAPDWLVVDHYDFDASWHGAVRAFARGGLRLAAIDDLADRALAVDLLVDHNLVPTRATEYASRVPAKTQRLLGPRFALIDTAYAAAPRYAFAPTVRSIGIFMGGADAAGFSERVLEACRARAAFGGAIEIATTRANPHLDALRRASARWAGTVLQLDQPDLADFFARHDLQIGAGGGATWERCSLGAPTLALAVADNQRVGLAELARRGVVATSALDPQAIGEAVRTLLSDAAARRGLHNASLGMVDGRGAERVALAMSAGQLQLRGAAASDSALAFAWRNHPGTRAVSGDPTPLVRESHDRWWQQALDDPARRLWIGHCGPRPIGVLRFDLAGDAADTSIYLDPALTGIGLGPHLLAAGLRQLASEPAAPATLRAVVRPDNAGSQALFRKAGFQRIGDDCWELQRIATAAVR